MSASPMLATAGGLPRGPGWAYEFKWDGVRALVHIDDGRVRLFARSGAEITAAYPELQALGYGMSSTVLDGEIVAMGADGRPSFSAVAERMHVRDSTKAAVLAAASPVTFIAFDVPRLGGVDLTDAPYQVRRAALEVLELNGEHWLTSPVFYDGEAALAAARVHQLEGVMAKRLDSPYQPGVRSASWVKVKFTQSAEFLVGGWRSDSRVLSTMFIGTREGGGFVYRGRVGGGFSAADELALLGALIPLVVERSPFTTGGPPQALARGAVWTRPELVIEVAYDRLMPDGKLRFPRFLRVRTDLTTE